MAQEMHKSVLNWFTAGILVVAVSGAEGRDYISIVGSSTVYPFTTVVAEQFGKTTHYRTPTVESTGSGGGLKLFCAGIGTQYPDITNSSRRIKASEVARCTRNGVSAIVEIKVGYDGIVIAHARKTAPVNFTLRDIYLALAQDIPHVNGGLQANPARTWRDVRHHLPPYAIEVMGPPPTSGTRDAFAELVLEGGCKTVDWVNALKKSDQPRYKRICHTVREDRAYVELGENDNLIIQKLEVNPTAFGVFGFSFLDQNSDRVSGALLNGVAPTFDNIVSGAYPVSRPLYIYVKKAHAVAIPGIRVFLAEFTSAAAWGEEGYLSDKGLIPMPVAERVHFRTAARALTELKL